MDCLRVGPVVQFGEMDRSRIGPPLNRLNQWLNHKPNEPNNYCFTKNLISSPFIWPKLLPSKPICMILRCVGINATHVVCRYFIWDRFWL